MIVLYILGYLLMTLVAAIIFRFCDNRVDIFDGDPEMAYPFSMFWPIFLPIFLIVIIELAVYCLTEYVVESIEKKFNI